LRQSQLALSWREGDEQYAGIWQIQNATGRASGEDRDGGSLSETVRVLHRFALPRRAHGVVRLDDSRLLFVARRPGDWLLELDMRAAQRRRTRVQKLTPRWHWITSGTAFNGHARLSQDGAHMLTSETDLETGMGQLGVRDARTLALVRTIPTQGRDPHDLLLHPHDPQLIYVANGGIDTRPETGRAKYALDQMDSSLQLINWHQGKSVQAWRLQDPMLSMRHLAACAVRGSLCIGVALQAEHSDADKKQHAPILAVLDGEALRTVHTPNESSALGGYGGDIIATSNSQFMVSATRAHRLLRHDLASGTSTTMELREAGALGTSGKAGIKRADQVPSWLAAGPDQLLSARVHETALQSVLLANMQPDNHMCMW
jgi:uncharacterized protein